MSSTTPNIGLTKTTAAETIGQNWAASNDSGGNFDIIDTKMGAVGNTSLQAQVTALNSKLNTYTTITPTAYSNRVNIVTSHCYQIGRWVIVYLQLHSNQVLAENTIITGLPAPAQRMGLMVDVSGATAIVSTNQADGVFANGVPTNTDFIISGAYNTLQG